MRHPPRQRGDWPIALGHSSTTWLVEITDMVEPAALRRILLTMHSAFPVMSLSQYVDPRQWDVGERNEFSRELAARYGVSTYVTERYSHHAPPTSSTSPFALHVLGRPAPGWIDAVARFGMTELAHVGYAASDPAEVSLSDVLSWNGLLVDWFGGQRRLRDAALVSLVDSRRLISMAIDGHVVFLFTDLEQMDELFRILETTAKEHGLTLQLRPEDITAEHSRWKW